MSSVDRAEEDGELSQALVRCLKSRTQRRCQPERLCLKLEYLQRPENEHLAGENNARRVTFYTKALQGLVGELDLKLVNDYYRFD